MKKSILYFILLLSSCKSETSELSSKHLSFSENLQEYITTSQEIADSVKNGFVNHEFADGIQVAFKVENSQIDSIFKALYPSGKPKALIHFSKGGFGLASHTEYYHDEIDYVVSNEVDTFEVTEPKISRFYFTNHEGRIIYLRTYNSEGKPEKSQGSLVATTRVIDKLHFTSGELIQIQYYLVAEPYPLYYDLSRQFFIQIYHQDSLIKKYDSPIDADCSCVVINERFTNPGNYRFEAIANYEDVYWTGKEYLSLSTMSDTAQVDIEVKETVTSSL